MFAIFMLSMLLVLSNESYASLIAIEFYIKFPFQTLILVANINYSIVTQASLYTSY